MASDLTSLASTASGGRGRGGKGEAGEAAAEGGSGRVGAPRPRETGGWGLGTGRGGWVAAGGSGTFGHGRARARGWLPGWALGRWRGVAGTAASGLVGSRRPDAAVGRGAPTPGPAGACTRARIFSCCRCCVPVRTRTSSGAWRVPPVLARLVLSPPRRCRRSEARRGHCRPVLYVSSRRGDAPAARPAARQRGWRPAACASPHMGCV